MSGLPAEAGAQAGANTVGGRRRWQRPNATVSTLALPGPPSDFLVLTNLGREAFRAAGGIIRVKGGTQAMKTALLFFSSIGCLVVAAGCGSRAEPQSNNQVVRRQIDSQDPSRPLPDRIKEREGLIDELRGRESKDEENTRLAALYGQLGDKQAAEGDLVKAEASFEKAHELNPKSAAYFSSLGKVFAYEAGEAADPDARIGFWEEEPAELEGCRDAGNRRGQAEGRRHGGGNRHVRLCRGACKGGPERGRLGAVVRRAKDGPAGLRRLQRHPAALETTAALGARGRRPWGRGRNLAAVRASSVRGTKNDDLDSRRIAPFRGRRARCISRGRPGREGRPVLL